MTSSMVGWFPICFGRAGTGGCAGYKEKTGIYKSKKKTYDQTWTYFLPCLISKE